MILIKDILYGMAIGDALGVPYEFKSRLAMYHYPCIDMIGNASHNQPKGTWSDDTSLALATVSSLSKGYDIKDIASNFVKWRDKGYFTCNGDVFDIGNSTNIAIEKIKKNELPVTLCGGYDERSNGNGSLMRILPILDYLVYLYDKTTITADDFNKIISDLSALTHRNSLSIKCCNYLISFAYNLNQTKNKEESLENLVSDLDYEGYKNTLLYNNHYDFINLPKNKIKSGGYVLDTLEASIWCLLTTDNYKDAVLKAVNLGDDTDTTACVTGGLAGILYGYDNIPKEWINDLRNKEMINDIIEKYEESKIISIQDDKQ